MARKLTNDHRVRRDTRAVSALVGAILLLGILVIALSSYQAAIVPQQNAETEFDHNQQVEDEMVDFRNALLEARLDERERATSVELGTRYQSRTIAVNPPPAPGTIQSVEQEDGIIVDSQNEYFTLEGDQFVEYTPSYAEYREAGTIRYENTLVYHDFENANVTLTDQHLLAKEAPSGFDVDGTIRLVPSEPDIDEQGIDPVSIEPTPERARFVTVTDPEITLPTDLPVDATDGTDWNELLDGKIDDDDEIHEENGNLVLELDGDYLIKYSFIGDPPDIPDERDDVEGNGDGRDTRVGLGDVSSFPETDSDTISVPGGLWQNITNVDGITLDDPRFTPRKPDGDLDDDERYFSLGMSLTDGDETYELLIGGDDGIEFDLDDGDVDDAEITIVGSSPDDGDIEEEDFDLDKDVVEDWIAGDGEIDILSEDSYDDLDVDSDELGPGNVESLLDNDEDVEIFITELNGRTDVTLES